MPELPEVQTTVNGLNETVVNKKISDVWSDFHLATARSSQQSLKNEKYYKNFRDNIIGAKIKNVERKGKNIIINLSNNFSVIIHMKMTGHLMVGKYEKAGKAQGASWKAIEKGPLQDPYNKFIHFVITFTDRSNLVLSDVRKFATVTVEKTDSLHEHDSLSSIGPDALKVSPQEFKEIILKKKNFPIKTALMDQTGISGIGNIYSDEILWAVGVHPLSKPTGVPNKKFADMYKEMIRILEFSIRTGGDSKSDYRNIYGEKGGFQNFHKVYGRRGEKCTKKGCSGIIKRIVVKGRSAHFCPVHQKIY